MTALENRSILEKLRAQRDSTASAMAALRTELDIMLVELVGDVHRYLYDYVFENVRRDIHKKSDTMPYWKTEDLDVLHRELDAAVAGEMPRIVETLRQSKEWYDTDVVFLDKNTNVWKAVCSVDAPVNKLLKKHGLGPVKLRNWAWLGEHLDMMANDRYPPAKREFIEKQRELQYLETRIRDEEHGLGLFPGAAKA